MWNKALNGHGLEPRPLDLALGPPCASLHTLQSAQFGAKKGGLQRYTYLLCAKYSSAVGVLILVKMVLQVAI